MTEVRRTFHQELDQIRADIVRLAALITECIPRGTDVLLANDLHGAQLLIEADDEMDSLARKSVKKIRLNSFCTVFSSTEILTRIREGESVEDMVNGAFEAVAQRVLEMDSLDGNIVMTGGVVAYNRIVVDIVEKHLNRKVSVPPQPQLTGALGAALFAEELSAPA